LRDVERGCASLADSAQAVWALVVGSGLDPSAVRGRGSLQRDSCGRAAALVVDDGGLRANEEKALHPLMSLFVLGFAWVFNRALTDTEDHLSQQYEVHDLVALSLNQDASLLPSAYWAGSRPLGPEEMGAIYDPIEPSFLFWPARPMAHFDLVTNPRGMPRPASLSALHSAWWRGLVRFPTVILRRRWFLVTEMFGLRREYGCYDYVTQMKPNALGIRLGNPAMHDAASAALELFRHGLLYRSWIYLALLAGCVVAAVRSGDGGLRAAVVAVAFSGLGSVVAYPLIGSGCDFRYLWWLMITSLLCLLLVMTGRRASDAGS
jgi:hypothetical protein